MGGFGRFTEDAADRGAGVGHDVDEDWGACPYMRSGLVAQDMDSDGDVDVVLHETDGALTLYVNEGGQLTAETVTAPTPRDVYATSAVDLDGDGLPELAVVGQDLALVSWNLGERAFSDWEEVFRQDEYPRRCHVSMSWGDIDGDGDLDLALPGADEVTDADAVMPSGLDVWTATPDRLIRNDGDSWTLLGDYGAEPDAISLVHAFTDRDKDGDLDWFAGTDRKMSEDAYGTTAFHRNDGVEGGVPVLVEDAADIGMDTWAAAMGMVVADVDRDGLMDYCVSDFADQLRCFINEGVAGYVDAGQALGLAVDLGAYSYTPDEWPPGWGTVSWVSWALVYEDLDNDGYDDMAAVASTVPDRGNALYGQVSAFQPNVLWAGVYDGFDEVSEESGFGAASSAYDASMVSADLDGDGFRELIVGSHTEPLRIFDNPCGEGSWLEVEVVGADRNAQGYGTRVEVTAGGETQMREVHNLFLVSQNPAPLHFGLGDVDLVDRLRVIFQDGEVVEAEHFAGCRTVRVEHP
ncbi:MAG: CRTAC1 family protein [Proteobacteria bacterium]|nr:CRTAC1 family protein [Pseudomonadota bacterium]MCP4915826.1 CRTAC1 family protein [Pseudomonadota bacterium]